MLTDQERNQQAYLSICSELALYSGSDNPLSYQSGVVTGLKLAKISLESWGCVVPAKEVEDV